MRVAAALERLVDRLAGAEGLDTVVAPVAAGAGRVLGARPVKDALSGSWLGHPLHPLLTDVPVGAWTSAVVLDLIGGEAGQGAADQLVALGVAAAVPTVLAGLSDWSDLLDADRRVGAVHALANAVGLALFATSYGLRRTGRRGRGRVAALAGALAVGGGGYLGGHLSYRRGIGVDRNAWKDRADGWVSAGPVEVAEGSAVGARAGDDPVVVARLEGQMLALGDVCSHAGGPLHEGGLDGGCITCPWHGSRFDLRTGAVQHGPATAPQPCYDTRADPAGLTLRQR